MPPKTRRGSVAVAEPNPAPGEVLEEGVKDEVVDRVVSPLKKKYISYAVS
jgi:hypothetical protein